MPPAGEAIVAEIIAAGGEALFVEHDVASEASWAAAVEKTVDRFGELTTLVNNAGLNHMRDVEDETVEGWDHIVSNDQKIGRASCRARVCQYVSISVVP